MLKNLRDPKETREAMLSLPSTAGTLAGIGIALVDVVILGSMTLMVLAGFIVAHTLM